jgi:hypothetical protein
MTYSASMSRQRVIAMPRRADVNKAMIDNMSRTVIFVVMACLLGLVYLVQVTKTNALGYQLNGLQGEQTKLQAQHDDLELQAARLQNLDRAQQYADDNNMVAVAP